MYKVEINQELKKVYNFCLEQGYEPLGVFVFGSQNYDLDSDNSDIDIKVIYLGEEPEEGYTLFERESEEGFVQLVSLENFLVKLKSGYHTWYEILFTEYFLINPKYRTVWENVRKKRDALVRENIKAHLLTELDYLKRQKSFMDIYLSSEKENKRLSYFYRIKYLIDAFIEGYSYKDCLVPFGETRDTILWLKNKTPLTLEECKARAQNIIQETKETVQKYLLENNLVDCSNTYDYIVDLLRSAEERKDDTQL